LIAAYHIRGAAHIIWISDQIEEKLRRETKKLVHRMVMNEEDDGARIGRNDSGSYTRQIVMDGMVVASEQITTRTDVPKDTSKDGSPARLVA